MGRFVLSVDGFRAWWSASRDVQCFRAREGRSVDALAPGGDEGRGTLRKATGSREQALIRGYPNGATHPYGVSAAEYIGCRGKPGELKHLSTRRKRHQQRFR